MSYIKYVKIIVIVSILMAAFIALPFVYNKWREAESRVSQVSQYAIAKTKEAEHYQNEFQREVIKTEALELDKKALGELKEDFEYLSKEFSGVKKNLKNIEQITRMSASVVDTVTVLVEKDKSFEYRDEWTRIAGIVVDDSVTLSYNVEVPIDVVVITERKKILGLKIGKKKVSAQATSKNKSVTITGLENITIR